MGNARSTAIARQNGEIEASQKRAISAREGQNAATQVKPVAQPRTALQIMSDNLKVPSAMLKQTLRSTVFAKCNDDEFLALIVVANEYGLNPLLKEIFAFPSKGGGITPMVSIDGWIRIMNEHPAFDGIDFDFVHDEKGGIEAVEAIIYRKDRNQPVRVMEFLDENFRNTEPWKMMPRRMLRHRALIQAVRIAFGFSGIRGEDDLDDMVNITPYQQQVSEPSRLPDRRSLAEELNDEIPNHNKDTGEIIEQDESSAGMTEVDEDTARQLDAAQDGYVDDGAEDTVDAEMQESPSDVWLHGIRQKIGAAKTVKGLIAVDAEWVNARAAYDDDTAASVDALMTQRRKALQAGV